MTTLLYTSELQVRWSDIDAFGHVNNGRFLTFFEEARIHWLLTLSQPWVSERLAPVLAAVHVNFRRPLEWPETVQIELRTQRIGNSSLTLEHRVVSSTNAEVLYADGHSVMVWTDRQSGQSIELPEFIRRAAGTTPTQ